MATGDRPGQSSALAVFGDFWRQAARLASPPPYPDPPAGAQQVHHITAASLRAVTVMRRYIGDISRRVRRPGRLVGSRHRRAQTATTRIIGALRQETAPAPEFPAGSLAARLDGYAAALTYGRDLLHTHLATTAYGGRHALSDWAPVISSAPVNRALLAGLADHARAIAGQLAGLPLDRAADAETVAAWQRLQARSRAAAGTRRRCPGRSVAGAGPSGASSAAGGYPGQRHARRAGAAAGGAGQHPVRGHHQPPRSALTRLAGSLPPGLRGLRSSPQTRCATPPPTTS